MWISDAKGTLIRINPACCELFNLDPKEVIGKYNIFEDNIVAQQGLMPKVESVFQQGRAVNFEIVYDSSALEHLELKNTVAAVLDVNIFPVKDQKGQVTNAVIQHRDITRRKWTEEALTANENRYQELFDNMSAGVGVYEAVDGGEDFIFKDVNEAALRITHKTKEELLGKRVSQVYPGIEDLGLPDVFRRVWRSNKPETCPSALYMDQHLNLWLDIYVYKLPSGELVSIYDDITERKRVEQELLLTKFSTDSASASIFRLTQGGEFIYINDTACKRLGYSREELIGKNISLVDPDYPTERQAEIWEQFKYNQVLTFETKHRTKDGKIFPVEVTCQYMKYEKREYVFVFAVDISERKKLENQLRHAQKMEAIGTLAGGIAHDFNNILGAIIGYTELSLNRARRGISSPQMLSEVLKAANRAKDLVSQILAFSRKSDANLKPLNINEVVTQSVKLLEHTLPKMINIRLILSPDLKKLRGDRVQLEQVIMNLGANASDAMPDGGSLTIETQNVTLGEEYSGTHMEIPPGPYVLLSVSDNGLGMDKDTVQHIFDPFYTTKEVGKGTGLGLSTVYGIVKNHGGYTSCYSEPGHGTTFKIFLPSMDQQDLEEALPSTLEEKLPGGTETILLVDDEAALLDIGRIFLSDEGYQIITAGSGEEALKIFQGNEGHPDLVILDVGMPGMGGQQCLAKILQIDPSAKVIITSGYSRNNQLKRILEAGASGFVAKPFQRADLLLTVRQVLGLPGETASQLG
jgi:PAS domain S-box-containing protein